jgi:hypothetical protein
MIALEFEIFGELEKCRSFGKLKNKLDRKGFGFPKVYQYK